MRVRLTQIDGKLPNLALMKIAAWHRARGDEVVPNKHIMRELDEGHFDRVYGSAIFNFSTARVERFKQEFPQAIIGGTWNTADRLTVEDVLAGADALPYDYSIYPWFDGSIGFTQRGCRLKCGFCVVPKKEGKNHGAATIAEIWRGPAYPKHLHLLDNDFFGNPEWPARAGEIIAGNFKICLNQGINTRMIDDESAAALKAMGYWDDSFKTRRLYTAWDNIGDEKRFFDGVETLAKHGIPPSHLLVYMLIGYDKRETWEKLLYRFERMVAIRIRPYPMVFGDGHRTLPIGDAHPALAKRTLKEFQRYAIRRLNSVCPFHEYDTAARAPEPNQYEMPLPA